VRAAVVGVLGFGQVDGDAVASRNVQLARCIRMLLDVIFEQEYFDFLDLVQPAIVGYKERSS
jgi:hypothetical protein